METGNGTVILDGKKLRQLREERRLTQLYLATAVAVTIETISRWENKAAPSIRLENARRLAAALQVPIDVLLAREGNAEDIGEQPAAPQPVTQKRLPNTLFPYACAIALGCCVLALFWYGPGSRTTAPAPQAHRLLPRHTLPGDPFPVVLQVQDGGDGGSLMLREQLPAGTTLLHSSPPCVGTGQDLRQLKWISPANGQKRRSFLYVVQPVPQAAGWQYHFAGSLVTGDRSSRPGTTQGEDTLTVQDCHWADENCDHVIDDYEMLSVFDLLPQGQDVGLDLETIKAIWAGQGYSWNQEAGTVQVLDRGSPAGAQPHQPAP